MPTLEANRDHWSHGNRWLAEGDEWSGWWGTTEAQWWHTVLPRIHRHLPASTILEIAPGHGRWTQFLRKACDRLIVVDLSPPCIEHCRARFAADRHIEYFVNDGRSLDMVADGSLDFVFTFDSLVHVEADVIEAYLQALTRKLAVGGHAFIHHSNRGVYGPTPVRLRRTLKRVFGWRIGRRLGEPLLADHWRGENMTAALFRDQCRRTGLHCLSQELVNWGNRGKFLIDCFSVVTRSDGPAGTPRVIENRWFMEEAAAAARLAPLYGAAVQQDENPRHATGGVGERR